MSESLAKAAAVAGMRQTEIVNFDDSDYPVVNIELFDGSIVTVHAEAGVVVLASQEALDFDEGPDPVQDDEPTLESEAEVPFDLGGYLSSLTVDQLVEFTALNDLKIDGRLKDHDKVLAAVIDAWAETDGRAPVVLAGEDD